MKLITSRDLIRKVPERWKAQYCNGGQWGNTLVSGSTKAVYEALVALDLETATADQVAAIIGNESWSRNMCNECGQNVDAVVEIGQPPDYESATAYACGPCLYKATALFGLTHNG